MTARPEERAAQLQESLSSELQQAQEQATAARAAREAAQMELDAVQAELDQLEVRGKELQVSMKIGYPLLFVYAVCVDDQNRGCLWLPASLPERREVALRGKVPAARGSFQTALRPQVIHNLRRDIA